MKEIEKRRRATNWWNTTGAALTKKQTKSNLAEVGGKTTLGNGSGPMIKIAPTVTPEITSGIMLGLPFNQLTMREQRRIVDVWYRNHIERKLNPALETDPDGETFANIDRDKAGVPS